MRTDFWLGHCSMLMCTLRQYVSIFHFPPCRFDGENHSDRKHRIYADSRARAWGVSKAPLGRNLPFKTRGDRCSGNGS